MLGAFGAFWSKSDYSFSDQCFVATCRVTYHFRVLPVPLNEFGEVVSDERGGVVVGHLAVGMGHVHSDIHMIE